MDGFELNRMICYDGMERRLILMDYVVKVADFKDMEEAVAVEKAAMGDYVYVQTAWNYYWNTKGAFLCAYEDGQMVGIAHLAVLPDGAGWFEALRVHPEHQNKGVGKALYRKALELIESDLHCTSLSMYTGPTNLRSAGLAALYGLTTVYEHKEYNYKVDGPKDTHGFVYADWEEAEKLALPLAEEYGNFVSVNRTWYRINTPNVRMLADKEFFYTDGEGNFVCVGTRFQHGKKLFVGMLGGDYRKGLDFAVNLAAAMNIPTVTCTFTAVNTKLEEALKDYGFTFAADLITKERVF